MRLRNRNDKNQSTTLRRRKSAQVRKAQPQAQGQFLGKVLGQAQAQTPSHSQSQMGRTPRLRQTRRGRTRAKTLRSQIINLTSVSILTHFLLTDKLLGYFPVNLDQFAVSGNKRDVNQSSGSRARALERHDPFGGGGRSLVILLSSSRIGYTGVSSLQSLPLPGHYSYPVQD